MSIPVLIHPDNGQFVATLIGEPTIRAAAPTRDSALTALQSQLDAKHGSGELVFLAVPRHDLTGMGTFRDDPTLRELCDVIYRQRDAEPKE